MEIVERVLGLLGKRPEEWIEHVPDRPNHDRRYLIDPAKLESRARLAAAGRLRRGTRGDRAWYVDHRAWWEAILARTGDLAFDWTAGARATRSGSRNPPQDSTAPRTPT